MRESLRLTQTPINRFAPAIYRDSQIALPLAGSLTAPEAERGKK